MIVQPNTPQSLYDVVINAFLILAAQHPFHIPRIIAVAGHACAFLRPNSEARSESRRKALLVHNSGSHDCIDLRYGSHRHRGGKHSLGAYLAFVDRTDLLNLQEDSAGNLYWRGRRLTAADYGKVGLADWCRVQSHSSRVGSRSDGGMVALTALAGLWDRWQITSPYEGAPPPAECRCEEPVRSVHGGFRPLQAK